MTPKEKERYRAVQPMEKAIRNRNLPQTDSIEQLARFWDAHDLTDFDENLEEAVEPVFVKPNVASLRVDFQPEEVQLLKGIAQSKGIEATTLPRQWILERLEKSATAGAEKPGERLPPQPRKAPR